MKGNCLTYALRMWVVEGFAGRIEPALVWVGQFPKARFYYVDAAGVKTYLYPDHPKAWPEACWHALWFKGHVRKA